MLEDLLACPTLERDEAIHESKAYNVGVNGSVRAPSPTGLGLAHWRQEMEDRERLCEGRIMRLGLSLQL